MLAGRAVAGLGKIAVFSRLPASMELFPMTATRLPDRSGETGLGKLWRA
jgi:hypothetical protein